MSDVKAPKPAPGPFDRKVSRSRLALYLERIWPWLWLPFGTAGVFLLVSLLGLWTLLSQQAHLLVLLAFGAAVVLAIVLIARVPWPTREDAVRRLEARSGLPHRPATTYEDTLTLGSSDPATQALWQAHRARLAALIGRLKVGRPEPRTDRYDPMALRVLLIFGVLLAFAFVGDSARDRVMAAFRFGPTTLGPGARLDAWVTPPAYTGKAPLMLADGAHSAQVAASDGKPLELPENSVLIARASGTGHATLSLDFKADQGQSQHVDGGPAVAGADVSEVKATLKQSGQVRVYSGSAEVGRWAFVVIPDQPPRITLTKDPEISRRGSMKLTYKVEDDYGVASAEARFEKLPQDEGVPRTAWAHKPALKGPRPPLERPPVLSLRLPRNNAKDSETTSQHELGNNAWAGFRVRMTLIARDHAGNIGRSQPVELIMPERQFYKPFARAVMEQRRKLAEDPRNLPEVLTSIAALTEAPELFIEDQAVFLGLRSAYHRLEIDHSRATLNSVKAQLFNIASRIEDGRGLTDVEKRLRDLQDQLSKALQNGASDEEIKQLMDQLRQTMAEFMQQLQNQLSQMPPMNMPNGTSPDQVMRPEDLERMLNQLENMARGGSRDQAQDMLGQLRDLLDQLQSGQFARAPQNGQGQQMMQMLDKFGDMIRREQQLMDDTFGEQRQQGEGQQPGQRGQRGQQGQGQQGQQGQGEQGQGQGRGLGQRQGQLRNQLNELQDMMRNFGQDGPSQLDSAGEAMDNARRALEQGDLETATKEEGRALEDLRQGAQQMAQQMLSQMPSRFGLGPALDTPRDPLGRPQRSEGTDPGTSVKVPDEIDTQRAREILEELRRRLGEAARPEFELEYLERLLRQY